jgi:hypothetical protein
VKKDDREIMEILEAFDLTGNAHSAAQLVGCDPKTVRRWVAQRDWGLPVGGPARRPRLIDPYLAKVEEWVDRSHGKVRADVVHERLVAVGFGGDERTTRRAVAEAKARRRAGRRRTYRPWITEPGMWCQFDWGVGPVVPWAGGQPRSTWLFCLWLAWSRFRVVIPTWDHTLPTLLACLDTALRRLGGAPTYGLTDNEKTVTVEHVARGRGAASGGGRRGAALRDAGGHVRAVRPGVQGRVGGSQKIVGVRIAKADLVPTDANLLDLAALLHSPAVGRRVAARTKATAEPTWPRPPREPAPVSGSHDADTPSQAGQETDVPESKEELAKVIPLGVFDPYEEAKKRW